MASPQTDRSFNDLDGGTSDKLWNRWECRMWTANLFVGTCTLYAARIALPICATEIAHQYSWNKNDTGTALSCFFWGYACTQILAGHLADRIGGERILRISSLSWALLTFFTPELFDLSYQTSNPMLYIIIIRSLTGIGQAFHMPSTASIISRHLTSLEKGRIFGICLAGSHLGTMLAGGVGSVLLKMFGWRSLFQFVGFISLIWWALIRYITSPQVRSDSALSKLEKEASKSTLLNGVNKSFLIAPKSEGDINPVWRILLKHPAFWAAAIAQYSGANAYYTMFSWLPSYFADSFPSAPGFLYNVVPSMAIIVTSLCAPLIASRVFARNHSLTLTRKLMEGISLIAMAICLLVSSKQVSFEVSLVIFTMAMAARGLHHGGVAVNPCDIAPNHTGFVFGIFNTFAAVTGFVGVYIAGHILHVSGNNWSYVFIFTSIQCIVGGVIYALFGTAKRII